MCRVGFVVIGRNEGARLAACLRSVRQTPPELLAEIVYVDSNSTDNSVEIAKEFGARVVQLNPALPFTAARARNAGAELVMSLHPEVDYLQFLDGDTELNGRWVVHAADYLEHHRGVAVVCGRRRERHPEASIYNLLADMEWDTPFGPAIEFGGDSMIRAAMFKKAGGYRPEFIAGEEPDLAARLRLAGHGIVRLNHEMTLHDLGMTKFGQWWRRTVRSGHALAQLAHTHGGPPLGFYKSQWRSTVVWTVAVPLFIVILSAATTWWGLGLFPFAYGYLAARIMRYRLGRGDDRDSAFTYACFTTVGKLPQLVGMVKFYRNLWSKRPSTLIEYKGMPATKSPNPAATPVGNT